jgi:hypothetical protein
MFLLAAGAGILIGALPITPWRPVFIASAIPAGFLCFILIAGFVEHQNIASLYWSGIPIGVVALINAPALIRHVLFSKTEK